MNIINVTDRIYINELASLFNEYRIFYQQASNLIEAKKFIAERLEKQESTIFLALDDGDKGVGFVQLYPLFSSIHMQQIYLLNDLYVLPAYRQQGIARQLMRAAKDFALGKKAHSLSLSTAITNRSAQQLYEAEGYIKDKEFFTYELIFP